jgi:hypothetical protein
MITWPISSTAGGGGGGAGFLAAAAGFFFFAVDLTAALPPLELPAAELLVVELPALEVRAAGFVAGAGFDAAVCAARTGSPAHTARAAATTRARAVEASMGAILRVRLRLTNRHRVSRATRRMQRAGGPSWRPARPANRAAIACRRNM